MDIWSNHLPTIERLNSEHLPSLPESARAWVSGFFRILITGLSRALAIPSRTWFHVRVASLRTIPAHGHDDRSQFTLQSSAGGTHDARTLILVSRDFATRHVEDFITSSLRRDF